MATIDLFTDAPTGIGQFLLIAPAAGDPGAGNFTYWAGTTSLEISDTAKNGLDVGALIDDLTAGNHILLYSKGETRTYSVTSVSDNGAGGWHTVVVTEVSSSTSFALNTGDAYSAQLFGGQEGTHGIDTHDDVDTTTTPPTTGQALVWQSPNWVPGTVASGGGGGSGGSGSVVAAEAGFWIDGASAWWLVSVVDTWEDVPLDVTEIETDNTIIDHDGTSNIGRITIKEDGYYEVYYNNAMDNHYGLGLRVAKNVTKDVLPTSEGQNNQNQGGSKDAGMISWQGVHWFDADDYIYLQAWWPSEQTQQSGVDRGKVSFGVRRLPKEPVSEEAGVGVGTWAVADNALGTPTAGQLTTDDANPNSVTQFKIHYQGYAQGAGGYALLDSLEAGDFLHFTDPQSVLIGGEPSSFVFKITSFINDTAGVMFYNCTASGNGSAFEPTRRYGLHVVRAPGGVAHRALTDNPHATDLGNLGSGTVGELNDIVANALVDGDLTGLTPADASVTLAKMADMATASFIGRDTAATGTPEVLSGAEATALLAAATTTTAGIVELATDGEDAADKVVQGNDARLDTITTSQNGLVPQSGASTALYLKGDGTWADPSAGSGHGTTNSIDDHGDVDIVTDAVSEGEVLVWRTDEFVPEPPAAAPTLTKSITIPDPVTAEDITFFYTPVAITITEIVAVVRGTTPSVLWFIKHETLTTGRDTAGTAVITAGTTTTDEGGVAITTFDDATIPAGSFLWIETTTVSGTNNELALSVECTED